MSRMLSLVGLAVLTLALGGCQFVESPTTQVQGVEVTRVTDHGTSVDVTVLMENPNDVPLPLRASSYRVTIDGVGDFDFTDRLAYTIPANGQQVVVLPAAFATQGQDVASRPARVTGSVTYEPPGEMRAILTESGIPLPTAAFSSQTEVRQ